jgi:sulfoxide reductase heme-binding subunit YedZ
VRAIRPARPAVRARRRLKPITLIKWLGFVVSLVPAAWLAVRFYRHDLTANPVDFITDYTGDWAISFLIISLGVTPLRRLTHWNDVVKLRRMLGLFAFFYATLHLLTWVIIDKYLGTDTIRMAVEWMVQDIFERPFITVGMATWVILFLLAITSNMRSIRLLGRRWQHLHRLVYAAGIGAVIHFWWLVKADITLPRRWAVTLAILFAVRLWWMMRKRMSSAS